LRGGSSFGGLWESSAERGERTRAYLGRVSARGNRVRPALFYDPLESGVPPLIGFSLRRVARSLLLMAGQK